MRALTAIVLTWPLLACSASLRRPVWTTDAARDLEQVTTGDANEFDPAVSPDGAWLAYEGARTPDAVPHVEVIALGDAQPGRAPRVAYTSAGTMGLEPAWMPDGTGLVFVSQTRGSPRGLVQTVGPGAASTRFLADAGDPYVVAEWPSVSPDGHTMAMSLVNVDVFRSGWRSARHFDHALGLSDLLGTGTTTLGAGSHPAWSPDGRRIAFARVTDGRAHLFVADADGARATQITEGAADDIEPAWSPDGRFLVFCSAHGDAYFTQSNLFAVRPDGEGLVQLTEGDRVVGRPTVAKDGRVYFHANASDRFHVWRVRVDGALGGG